MDRWFCDYNLLTGIIPTSLGKWSKLRTAKFDNNKLEGMIPSEFSKLKSLMEFQLSMNLLEGTVSAAFSSWTSIQLFNLGFNSKISGYLSESLASLALLAHFNIQGTEISGTLPPELASWASILNFNMVSTSISGSLPELSTWQQLTSLDVRDTELSGTLPTSASFWISLSDIALSYTKLSGSLSSSAKNWTVLRSLELVSTQISGTLASEFSCWSNLLQFVVSDNKFSGSLPPSYSSWSRLGSYSADFNSLSGTLPFEYGNFNRLRDLNVASNKLSGSFPSSYSGWVSLISFNAGLNYFSGTIPFEYSSFKAINRFAMFQNSFTGALPDFSLWSSSLRTVTLAGNRFSGRFSASLLSPNLTSFDASQNQLDSSFQLTNLPASMLILNLSANAYKSLLLQVDDLTVPAGQTGGIVVDFLGNHLLCPFPSLSYLYQANRASKSVGLLRNQCTTNLIELIPVGVSFASCLLLLLALFLLLKFRFKCVYQLLQTWLKSNSLHYITLKFFVSQLLQHLLLVTTCLNFLEISIAMEVNSPDNCNIFNMNPMWVTSMYFPPNVIVYNSSNPLPPLPDSVCTKSSGTFSQCATEMIARAPLFPQNPSFVQANIDTFNRSCSSFLSGTCVYYENKNLSVFECQRINDPEEALRVFFSKLVFASVLIFSVKELLKQLAVFYSLVFGREPSAIVRDAVCAPLLLYSLGMSRFEQQVLLRSASWSENAFALFYDGPFISEYPLSAFCVAILKITCYAFPHLYFIDCIIMQYV